MVIIKKNRESTKQQQPRNRYVSASRPKITRKPMKRSTMLSFLLLPPIYIIIGPTEKEDEK
jgi:hypothetical protein